MYRYENMHPMWLPLVYRTQWQLGVINHFVLITSHSCSVSNSAVDLFFCADPFEPLIMRKINTSQIRADCSAFPQLFVRANESLWKAARYYLQRSAQPLFIRHFPTGKLRYSKDEINFICLHF